MGEGTGKSTVCGDILPDKSGGVKKARQQGMSLL